VLWLNDLSKYYFQIGSFFWLLDGQKLHQIIVAAFFPQFDWLLSFFGREILYAKK
jgi:hypothetical protein